LSISPELYDSIVHIVDQRIGEIRVTREDFNKLASELFEVTTAVKELAEAQKRAEARLEGAEARLDRLTETVSELAEAQKRTEGTA
jgi:predicted nuclease with TOPRIM domain